MKLPTECPMCGARDEDGFGIWSKDRVIAHIEVIEGPNGPEWGESEMFWDTSQTEEYFCGVCMEVFPERLQSQLDEALANDRIHYVRGSK